MFIGTTKPSKYAVPAALAHQKKAKRYKNALRVMQSDEPSVHRLLAEADKCGIIKNHIRGDILFYVRDCHANHAHGRFIHRFPPEFHFR
ncbi:hypothetical protein PEC730217_06200 [Pectobacterium carotovorum subsp. carotovorum]|nr:hypothetical protein PB70LOC_04356 [Pectobacterium versatile]GKV82049.1 hypothetical protein PEC106664_28230 [Pectobacterium carotovorum subsp. carotovorum]POY62850.1 hypothetical protein PB69LOC_02799 [Pectobacterium versatile]RUR90005.1 hypothetical protein PB16LOC_03653 [Pectobacterium versatile]GBO50190.1 hypothetical protein MFFDBJGM_03211 [Pectobacterium versatile]